MSNFKNIFSHSFLWFPQAFTVTSFASHVQDGLGGLVMIKDTFRHTLHMNRATSCIIVFMKRIRNILPPPHPRVMTGFQLPRLPLRPPQTPPLMRGKGSRKLSMWVWHDCAPFHSQLTTKTRSSLSGLPFPEQQEEKQFVLKPRY